MADPVVVSACTPLTAGACKHVPTSFCVNVWYDCICTVDMHLPSCNIVDLREVMQREHAALLDGQEAILRGQEAILRGQEDHRQETKQILESVSRLEHRQEATSRNPEPAGN